MDDGNNIKGLLVLPFFYPHRGGSQKYAEEIYVKLMERHPNVQIDVLCYNTDKVAKYEEYRGFRVHRIPCLNIIPARFALPNPIALVSILKKLAKNNYQFVNTHIRFFDPTWWVWLYAKKIKAKSIFTGHVATHPTHQNKVVALVAKLVDLTFAKAALKKYDYLTFTNKTAEKFFKEKLGVTGETHLIYGGIDTGFFTPKGKDSERTLPKVETKIGPQTTLITYVGRMIWTKGVTFLYDAIHSIAQETTNDVTFVLAGPGELEDILREKIKKDVLETKVIMTGDLKYEQVKDLLAISNIFINPSHHNEGFPNTVLEAGASGCFVIATDNAGTWEVIKDNETGLLVPQKDVEAFKNALIWAIKHPQEREEIAQNFRNRLVKEFDWTVISEQFYDLILSKA